MAGPDVTIRRIHDPYVKGEHRVLIDRLWPRGISKAAARLDAWAKELAPSDALRKWYHADPEGRVAEFKVRYRKELSEKKDALDAFTEELPRKGTVALLTAAKDGAWPHADVLRAAMVRRARTS